MSVILRRVSRPLLSSSKQLKPNNEVTSAGICHKDHIDPEIKRDKPAPWPYDRKRFGWRHQNVYRIDRCIQRFDENTVYITVEGLPGVGKTKFGIELAEQLGMRFYGQPDSEPCHARPGGFDLRDLNYLLPESTQHCDEKMMYLNPHHRAVPGLIMNMFLLKFFHAIEGQTHLFHTGQGVIHEGSWWSDFVWHRTLERCGFLYKDVGEHYETLFMETMQTIFRPHLVIYLHVPAEIAFERWVAKAPDYIKKSPMTTLKFFQEMEDLLYNTFLPKINLHAEVMVYDWTDGGDIEMVVEDLERQIDLTRWENLVGEKLEDWRLQVDTLFDDHRRLISNERYEIYRRYGIPHYDKPSIFYSQEAANLKDQVLRNHAPQYLDVFDPKLKGVLNTIFGSKYPHYRMKYEYEYFGTSLRDKWTQLICV